MHKPFLKIEDQIKRLESLGIIVDRTTATKILSENSYFSIINGYKDPFLFLGQKDKFINGTSLKEIYSLYDFDRKIRYVLLQALLSIETQLKTELVYNFLLHENKDTLQSNDIYLKINSYDPLKKKTNSVMKLISDLQRTISDQFSKSLSISHYIGNYGFVPLWVLSDYLSFGQISKFYSCLKPSVRQAISKKYSLQDNDFETLIKLLSKTRNSCAHGNRLYCSDFLPIPLIPGTIYPVSSSIQKSLTVNNKFINVLLVVKIFMPPKDYKALINQVDSYFKTLESKLNTISLASIKETMGIPNNWLNLRDKD